MLDYLDQRLAMPPAALNPALEQVAAYLLAWTAREGSFLASPTASRLPQDYAADLNLKLQAVLAKVDLPSRIISRHPGVSAVALQAMLTYFQGRKGAVEELLPSGPESDDAYPRLIAIFYRINREMTVAFFPPGSIPVYALITIEWMRGLPLGQIIRRRIAYLEEHNRSYNIAAVIRDTMRDVEEVARFRAPKYLSAYLDVLRFHLQQIGREELLTGNLDFDLYLEFGVATKTLLSLIGLGLSRTSAVALNDYLGDDALSEDQIFLWLSRRTWLTLDLPAVVKREIDKLLASRLALAQAATA
jgi:hypothetical protein